jgi:pantothenate kinase
MIRQNAQAGNHVLFEGILAQHSTGRLVELARDFSVLVIVLDTPRDIAANRVKQRRLERGDERPFDPKNVFKEDTSVQNSAKRLKAAGIEVLRQSPEVAFETILERFGWK